MASDPYLHVDTWAAAESLAVDWMRLHGYPDARATSGGADSGIDARATGALAQVKFRGAMTGRPVLQGLVGARGRGVEQLLCFSGTSFTEPAVSYAEEMDIALFTFTPAGVVTPVNGRAQVLARPSSTARPTRAKPAQSAPPWMDNPLVQGALRFAIGLVLAIGVAAFISSWVTTGRMNGTAFTVLLVMTAGAIALLWPALRLVSRGLRRLMSARRRDPTRESPRG